MFICDTFGFVRIYLESVLRRDLSVRAVQLHLLWYTLHLLIAKARFDKCEVGGASYGRISYRLRRCLHRGEEGLFFFEKASVVA